MSARFCVVALTIACLPIASTVRAVPVIETLYLQGNVLDGASLLPGFEPPDNSNIFDPISGDDVRNNGQGNLRASVNGNFLTSVRTNSDEGAANSAVGAYYLFGSTTRGDSPTALRREAMVAGIDQQSLGSPNIDNAGNTSYTTLTGNTGTAGSGFSVLWENDTPIFSAGDEILMGPLGPPPPASSGGSSNAVGGGGFFFGSPNGVYRSPAGVTTWVNSYRLTTDGEAVGTALMRGTSSFDVLLQSGDAIPGLPTPVLNMGGAIGSNIEWSVLGTNYLTQVAIPTDRLNNFGEPIFDDAPIINGQALFTANAGALIQDGELIPVADGGLVGESWKSFNTIWDVNEAGDYAIAGFTDAPGNLDDVLVYNGEIIHRNGDTVDGIPLAGQVQGVAINDLGDIAFVWNDTFFINDQAIAGKASIRDNDNNLIAGLGTLIDTNGDGVGDTVMDDMALGKMEITNLPAAGGDGLPVVYFAGEVGNSLDTYLRLAPAASLDGDYNGDGVVDAADYTVWRDTNGSQFLLAADGDQDNVVDADDYGVWAANFGATLPSTSTSVPEPAALALLVVSLGIAPKRR